MRALRLIPYTVKAFQKGIGSPFSLQGGEKRKRGLDHFKNRALWQRGRPGKRQISGLGLKFGFRETVTGGAAKQKGETLMK